MSAKKTRIVQSFVISKDYFPTKATARAVVKAMGGLTGKVDETTNFYRFRQYDPAYFQSRSFRHWHRGHGVREIAAIPKVEYQDWFYERAKEGKRPPR